MTDDPKVLNLNKARKARASAARKAQAGANAVKHGRTKAERRLEDARADRIEAALDRAKRDRE